MKLCIFFCIFIFEDFKPFIIGYCIQFPALCQSFYTGHQRDLYEIRFSPALTQHINTCNPWISKLQVPDPQERWLFYFATICVKKFLISSCGYINYFIFAMIDSLIFVLNFHFWIFIYFYYQFIRDVFYYNKKKRLLQIYIKMSREEVMCGKRLKNTLLF